MAGQPALTALRAAALERPAAAMGKLTSNEGKGITGRRAIPGSNRNSRIGVQLRHAHTHARTHVPLAALLARSAGAELLRHPQPRQVRGTSHDERAKPGIFLQRSPA